MSDIRQRNLEEMRRLLDTKELSSMTGVPERTFDQYAYQGRGPAFSKLGKHRRYRLEDVEAWINSNRHGGGDA